MWPPQEEMEKYSDLQMKETDRKRTLVKKESVNEPTEFCEQSREVNQMQAQLMLLKSLMMKLLRGKQ